MELGKRADALQLLDWAKPPASAIKSFSTKYNSHHSLPALLIALNICCQMRV